MKRFGVIASVMFVLSACSPQVKYHTTAHRALEVQHEVYQTEADLDSIINEALKGIPVKCKYSREEKGQNLKALSDLKTAIKLDPLHVTSYVNLCSVLTDLERYDEALEYIEMAIKLNPNSAVAYSSRGSTYYKLGKEEEAIADQLKAIQLNPKLDGPHNQIAFVYRDRKEFDLALEHATKSIELKEDSANYNDRGIVYLLMEDYDTARNDFMKALELDPKEFAVKVNLASLELQQNNFKEAIKFATDAIILNPTSSDSHRVRGQANMELKNYVDSQADFETAIILDPKDYQNYILLGSLFYNLGRFEEEIALQNKAIELNPKSEDA